LEEENKKRGKEINKGVGFGGIIIFEAGGGVETIVAVVGGGEINTKVSLRISNGQKRGERIGKN